jgi:hypothetical protein
VLIWNPCDGGAAVADMLRLVVWEMKPLPPQVARFLPSAEVAEAFRLLDETQEAERCCLEVAAANDAGGWERGMTMLPRRV